MAILLYANEHEMAMPDSLATLARASPDHVRPEVFVCPSDDARAAKDVARFRGDEHDCSYVYVGDGVPITVEPGGDVLVAFDRPDTHDGDGVMAMFADGHVEWMQFKPADGSIARGWRHVQEQIARGDRPIHWRDPTTRPAR